MRRKKRNWVEMLKNENEMQLRTKEEMEEAFRRRMIRTFIIGEVENAKFCRVTDREVEEWARTNREKVLPEFGGL